MVITPKYGVLKLERNADNYIIISHYTLRNIFPPQLKKNPTCYKVMCDCECCISAKSMHLCLLSWRNFHQKKIKDKSQNAQNRRSGEMANCIFETYKNSVMAHGRHIYHTVYAMVI